MGQFHDARFPGEAKWDYWKLWNFVLAGITSFSTGPLRLASYLGSAMELVASVNATWVVYKALSDGDPVAGYSSTMVVILFLGGVQLMTLGIIGEYVVRMFNESKRRPLNFVDSYRGPRPQSDYVPSGGET